MYRHVAPEETASPSTGKMVIDGNLAVRISLGTYKIFYESGSEEMMWRVRGREEEKEIRERAQVREEQRRGKARGIYS